MMLQKPDAVFFDWDGTLVDSYSFLNDAHSTVLTSLGFAPFKGDEFKNYFGHPREKLYREIYKDRSEEAKTLFEAYVMENNHKIQALPGAEALLSALHALGVPMGVVSNKKSSFIMREIEHHGWGDFFAVVVGAGEAQADKPSGKPLRLALEKAGITPGGAISGTSGIRKTIWLVQRMQVARPCSLRGITTRRACWIFINPY